MVDLTHSPPHWGRYLRTAMVGSIGPNDRYPLRTRRPARVMRRQSARPKPTLKMSNGEREMTHPSGWSRPSCRRRQSPITDHAKSTSTCQSAPSRNDRKECGR